MTDRENIDIRNDQENDSDNSVDSGADAKVLGTKPLPQEFVAKKRKLIVVRYLVVIDSLKTLNEYVSSCFN
jgi:hypothetical protein